MAQNVTIAGNQYPDVPSILVPKTGGGGNAIFADPSVVTAVAADVASGKYFLNSSGVLTQGTASGGGGASNVVTGTFTGTTTGAAMDVTLNYTGSGYPISVQIYPTGGMYGNSAFQALISRYAIGVFQGIKYDVSSTPDYSQNTTINQMSSMIFYKNSTTNASSISNTGGTSNRNYRDTEATSTNTVTVMFRTAKKMSVYFSAAGAYGFPINIEYTYRVIYSS